MYKGYVPAGTALRKEGNSSLEGIDTFGCSQKFSILKSIMQTNVRIFFYFIMNLAIFRINTKFYYFDILFLHLNKS